VLTIIVPVYNEAESVGPLAAAIQDALHGWSDDWELLFVDDGSTDDTAAAVLSGRSTDSRIRLIRLARNFGQSAAMQAGFDHARGDLIATMDGDLQNDPRDIPALLAKLEQGCDLVAGYRVQRQDFLISRRIPSWLGNAIARRVTRVAIRDSGCTLKVFRRELLERLSLYSDLHRFIPALAVSVAGARVAELPVRHHPRRFGRGKYGLSRATKVLPDLLTLAMLRRARERPLQMFAVSGILALVVAMVTSLVAAWDWNDTSSLVVLTAVATCWLSLAGFLILAGLIAESTLQAVDDFRQFDGVLLHRIDLP
jgi:glycosyltransferase involved in cell wall biosynthesis